MPEPRPLAAGDVAVNLAAVVDRIDAAADGRAVRLIAVAKTKPLDAIAAAVAAGQFDIGESYAQELQGKIEDAASEPDLARVRWHFIGGLQRNKIRKLGAAVHLWHSIDRSELVAELAKRAPGASLLIQVNATNEPQKSGCVLAETPDLVAQARDLGLDVQGLMTIGPTPGAALGTEPDVDAATAFGRTRQMADRLDLAECSMGMSGDLEAAIAQGSTMVRVGADIFGARERV